MVQSAAGQPNRRQVRQHSEAPGWGIGSWSTAVLPGASSYVDTRCLPPIATRPITMKSAQCLTRTITSQRRYIDAKLSWSDPCSDSAKVSHGRSQYHRGPA